MPDPVVTPPVPQNTPPTPPPVDAAEPEGAVDIAGRGRMAPVSAVIEERRGRQEARAEADRLRQENETLRKAKENWDAIEPYVPLLATHPDVTGKKPAPAAHTAAPDPELVEAAEALGFYKDDGTPDTDKASKAKGFFTKLVSGTVQSAIAPVAQTAAQSRAANLRERAYQVVDKQGHTFAAKEHIDAVLNSLPPEAAADPNIVNIALMVARGMGVPATSEPLHTEGGGGGLPGGNRTLSGLERAAASARGMTDEQWIKARDAKEDSNVLE